MNILLLDDEPFALNALAAEVRRQCPLDLVEAFTDPVQALRLTEGWVPDVAFLDIEIGPVSGLDVARELKKRNDHTNIIFVTAFPDYAVRSMKLHPSGYLVKPASGEEIREALDNLLYPPERRSSGIYASTFGNFELLVNGKPVDFTLSKAKEMLAYLVDREGAGVTRKELAAVLFQDREYTRAVQDYLSKIYASLQHSLKQAGAENLVNKGKNLYYLNCDRMQADIWDLRAGEPEALNAFHGEYMNQYTWAEAGTAVLNFGLNRKATE